MTSRRIDITHDENKTKAKKKYEEKDPYRAVIDNVVHIVEKGLKQIHKRNINERICETYAFILYDNWWSEQEVRHNEKMKFHGEGGLEGEDKCNLAQVMFYLVCLHGTSQLPQDTTEIHLYNSHYTTQQREKVPLYLEV